MASLGKLCHSSPLKEKKSTGVDISCDSDHAKQHTALMPVSPFASGEGLPYAPVGWPCPGDIWSWKVGRRVSGQGYYMDRFLIPPEHLRVPGSRKQGFGGKSAVENYIWTKFPSADQDSFFASFTWLIPAEPQHRRQVLNKTKEGNQEGDCVEEATLSIPRKRKHKSVIFGSRPHKVNTVEKAKRVNQEGECREAATHPVPHEVCDALKHYSRCPKVSNLVLSEKAKEKSRGKEATCTIPRGRKPKRSVLPPMRRHRTRQSCKLTSNHNPSCPTISDTIINIDLSEESDNIVQNMRISSNTESNQVSSGNTCISPTLCSLASCQDLVPCRSSTKDANNKSSVEAKTGDFDYYINSLEEILAQPLSLSMPSAPRDEVLTQESKMADREMAEAHGKLSSLLAMDLSLLVSTGRHTEFANLLGVLQRDPSLAIDQLVKLKQLEVIPLISKQFLEDTRTVDDARVFFEDLGANLARANSCKEKYNESKEKVAQVQKEIDSNSLTVQEIDDQIAMLKLRRDELANAVSTETTLRNELILEQEKLAKVILPGIVSKVQKANSEKMEWELKKSKAVKRQAEAVATYACLREKIL